jgi:hypothetical protein
VIVYGVIEKVPCGSIKEVQKVMNEKQRDHSYANVKWEHNPKYKEKKNA